MQQQFQTHTRHAHHRCPQRAPILTSRAPRLQARAGPSTATATAGEAASSTGLPLRVMSHRQRRLGQEVDALQEKALLTLSQALADDPGTQFFVRPGRGQVFYLSALRLLMRSYPASPQLISSADGSSAALCYFLPRLDRLDLWGLLLGGLLDIVTAAASVRPEVWRGRSGGSVLNERRNAFVKAHGDCALYVLAIGTEPRLQSQGRGSHLMRAITDVADRQQVHVYLEATSARNVRFYKRHGFIELSTECVRPEAPLVTLMFRPPAPPSDQQAAQQQDAAPLASSSSTTVSSSEAAPGQLSDLEARRPARTAGAPSGGAEWEQQRRLEGQEVAAARGGSPGGGGGIFGPFAGAAGAADSKRTGFPTNTGDDERL